jgi:hypothetical protein
MPTGNPRACRLEERKVSEKVTPRPLRTDQRRELKPLSQELSLVQKYCEGNQSYGDDPQDDVFAALFLVGHTGKYSTPAIAVQVRCLVAKEKRSLPS